MRARSLILAALAITALLPARLSAQDQPRLSVLKSVGVTAAELGGALAGSCVGALGVLWGMEDRIPLLVSSLALTPALSAAGAYGIGVWIDRGGSFGAAALGGYLGAVAGIATGAGLSLVISLHGEDNGLLLPLVGFPIGCAVGSVVGYKLSRRRAVEEASRWQLIPPSMGLAVKRPATGRPMEIAGVRLNLVGARF